MVQPSDLTHAIAVAVREAGGRALIVGGWVRDRLLGLEPTNIDIEVFGVPPDRLRELLASFGKVEAVGESFQVYKLGTLDVSLPRRDSKAGRGHRGFVVVGDPDMSIEEAARRRDFTVNAMSRDPLTNEDFDPFHGREDLERRILRVVDPATFADDSLRVLRAIQLAARFELTLEDRTRTLCREMALDDLPAERVWGEVEKLLVLATAVHRLRPGDGPGCRLETVAGIAGAGRVPAGTRLASRRRRLGATRCR